MIVEIGLAQTPFVSQRRAFSRKELLIVVATVFVLGSLGWVGIVKVNATAKNKTCQKNLRSLLMGFSGFVTVSNQLPTGGRGGDPKASDWIHWQADRYFQDGGIAAFVPSLGSKELQCPLDPQVRYREFPYSYSMNVFLERLDPAECANKNSLILLFEESLPNDGACVPGEPKDRLTPRHAGRSNAGFLDGRVESVAETNAITREHVRPQLRH